MDELWGAKGGLAPVDELWGAKGGLAPVNELWGAKVGPGLILQKKNINHLHKQNVNRMTR